MLKLLKLLPGVRMVKAVRLGRPASATVPVRADLQIRNLLDDPGLRRAMGLDQPVGAPPFELTIHDLVSPAELPIGDHVSPPIDLSIDDPVSPAVELVAHQPDTLADLRQVVRNAAA